MNSVTEWHGRNMFMFTKQMNLYKADGFIAWAHASLFGIFTLFTVYSIFEDIYQETVQRTMYICMHMYVTLS